MAIIAEQSIHQFRIRLATLLLMKEILSAVTLWAFLAGTAGLVLRYLGFSPAALLWGFLTLPLAIIPAILWAIRRLPNHKSIRAVLDHHSACGGLLMADGEVQVGGWKEKIPAIVQPRLQWKNQRALGLLGAGLGFVLLGFLLPTAIVEMGIAPRLNIEQQQAKLEKQVDVLKELSMLEPRKADDIKSKLDQIRRDALGKEPAQTLVDLDHLKDMLKKTAREAAEASARKSESMSAAEKLADLLKKKKEGDLSPRATTEAMQHLSRLTEKAAQENKLVQEGLDKDAAGLVDALKGGTLSPEQLEKLQDLLKEGKGDLSRQLDKLCKAELIDGEELESCKGAGECDVEGLTAFLMKCQGSAELCEGLAACEFPGRGGLTRGPGPAEMLWKDPSDPDGFQFKEQALPPSKLKALKDSMKTGVSLGTPQKGNPREAVEAGALTNSEGDGGSASTQIVLPRHRGAVERYFDRSIKSSDK